ncbi:MAG: AAC(3) family N-acetyltransferase [Lachnospiraceae bacterium]|nr:AAC(3) family N-acetyltransferase [Lachnospiraceae bacterium]
MCDDRYKEYVHLRDIVDKLAINKGDTLLISSDLKGLLFQCLEHEDDTDLNIFLESLMETVGSEGTILLPTFNWDFCKGVTFDYHRTPSRTGSLGKVALKRKDYVRTKHPLYSFAVWGKDAKRLYKMENKDSFGQDSPFAYLKEVRAKNLFIDVSYQDSFTFAHYAEEWEGNVPYRYIKEFTAGYIDEQGKEEIRTYSMFVRDLDKNVHVTINPMEEKFIEASAVRTYEINGVNFRLLSLDKAYELMKEDILNNRSRNLCTYDGQETNND